MLDHPTYPHAARQLIQQFQHLSGWEQKYKALFDLAKTLPPLTNEQQQHAQQVKGCENRVWLGSQRQKDGSLFFYGASESRIVQGLLALLLLLANGQTPQALVQLDITEYLNQFNITARLSLSRQQGLNALINAIKQQACSLNTPSPV